MAFELKNRLVIGISSRSLFNLSFENELFEREGKEAYIIYQMKNEKKIYEAGSALSLVKRLLKINDLGFEFFILISTFAALLKEDFKIYIEYICQQFHN